MKVTVVGREVHAAPGMDRREAYVETWASDALRSDPEPFRYVLARLMGQVADLLGGEAEPVRVIVASDIESALRSEAWDVVGGQVVAVHHPAF